MKEYLERQVKKAIKKAFEFMIPLDEQRTHIPEYLKDCKELIMDVYNLGVKHGKMREYKK